MARRTRLKTLNHARGQALLELAVFGSLMILVLGTLVQYALNFDFRQQADMEVFRRALASSAQSLEQGTPSGVSHVIIRDRHIPDPSNPLALGTVIPVVASVSSPVRSHTLGDVPDQGNLQELPHTIMDVNGHRITCGHADDPFAASDPVHGVGCVTGGFREEKQVLSAWIPKYNEIYGGSNVCAMEDGSKDHPPACGATPGPCLAPIHSPSGGAPCPDDQKTENIKLIDSVDGELVNYEAAVRQCRMIVDPATCIAECDRGQAFGSRVNCNQVCNLRMNPPDWVDRGYDPAKGGAWYCADYTDDYVFPHLEAMFKGQGIRSMGIQPGVERRATRDTALTTSETHDQLMTDIALNTWKQDTTRTFIFKDLGDTSGRIHEPQAVPTTSTNERDHETWTTPWED